MLSLNLTLSRRLDQTFLLNGRRTGGESKVLPASNEDNPENLVVETNWFSYVRVERRITAGSRAFKPTRFRANAHKRHLIAPP